MPLMSPWTGNFLDNSSRAAWQKVEGVTAGEKASGQNVTAQPQQEIAMPLQTELYFYSLVWRQG